MMRTPVLSSRSAPAKSPRSLLYESLSLFRELTQRLAPAIEFQRRVKALDSSWGVPRLFFFDEKSTTATRAFDDSPNAVRVARRWPDLAQAWSDVGDLLDDAFTLAAAEAEIRHAARAMPDLLNRVEMLATSHARARHFRKLLEIVDDETVTVLIPAENTGWRVRVRGIADLGQFHILLADMLPGPKPDPRLADACRFESVDADCCEAVVCWQFHTPDGAGLCESQSFRELPVVNGDRYLVADAPAYPRRFRAARAISAVAGGLELVRRWDLSESVQQRAA